MSSPKYGKHGLATASTLGSFRDIGANRGSPMCARPGANHGNKACEVIPGVWTAAFKDIDTLAKLQANAPAVTCVINAAPDTCPTRAGSYGDAVRVVTVDGFVDEESVDARQHFETVKAEIDGAIKDRPPSAPAPAR